MTGTHDRDIRLLERRPSNNHRRGAIALKQHQVRNRAVKADGCRGLPRQGHLLLKWQSAGFVAAHMHIFIPSRRHVQMSLETCVRPPKAELGFVNPSGPNPLS